MKGTSEEGTTPAGESGPRVGPGRGRTEGSLPSPGGALLLVFGVAFFFLIGRGLLYALLGEGGLVLGHLLFLGLPAVLYVLLRGHDPVRSLALRLPTRRKALGGVLILAGGVPLAWFLAWLQSLVVPVPVDYLEAMVEILTADSVSRYLWLIVMVAIVPAISEELLFRGPLLSGLRNGLPLVVAVVVSGLIFGLFHTSPQTGFRILPTAWLGILLAWVVVASGSLPLAVLLHFLNNGAIITLAAIPRTREMVSGAEASPDPLLLLAAVVLLVVGLRLLGRPPAGPRHAPGAGDGVVGESPP